MPTSSTTFRKRYLAAGHFEENPGYVVDRPVGCHDWLLIYTVSGKGIFHFESETLETKAHDAVLIAPGTSHRYEVSPTENCWELLWAHFLPPSQWRTWLTWPKIAPGWMSVHLQSEAARASLLVRFQEVVQLAAGYRPHREPLALNSLEAVLMTCHEQVVLQHGQGFDPRIGRVLDFICRHLDRSLPVEELARQCNLSESRFAHLFRQQMEMTPAQFVERQRIERASEMLEHTGYPISEIARQVGFENAFYFSRRFKKATGQSPRDYRRLAN